MKHKFTTTAKKRPLASLVASLALGFLASTPASAATYDLGKIEKPNAIKSQSLASSITVSGDEIDERAYQNAADALKAAPGVFVQPPSSSRGEPGIGIRGYSATHVGLFVDGIPVHSIYDRQTDWGMFAANSLGAIEIQKGFVSPAYGLNALGGAVNLISKKPEKPLEARLRYGFVTNNEHQASVGVGTKQNEWYASADYSFVKRKSLNLSNKFTETPYETDKKNKKNSYYESHTFKAKVGFTPSDEHEYSLNFIYQKGKKGGLFNANSGGNWWEWPNYDKMTFYILGNSQLTEKLNLNTKLYYDSFYNKLISTGKLRENGTLRGGWTGGSLYDDYTVGLVETLGYQLTKDQLVEVGLNLRQDNHKNTNYNPDGSVTRYGNVESIDKLRDVTTSIFAKYSNRLNDIFRFSLSTSYDRNSMSNVFLPQKNGSIETRHGQSFDGWTLQGILYAALTDELTLHINAGKKNKLLTLKERYSEPWGGRTRNPNLSPESALNFEFGATFETKDMRFWGVAFDNELTDMLSSVPDETNSCVAGSGCSKLVNVKEGRSYGFEVGGGFEFLGGRVGVGASYAFTRKKVTNEKAGSFAVDGSRVTDYPEHQLNLNAFYKPFESLKFTANFMHQNGIYVVNSDSTKFVKNPSISTLELKADFTLSNVPNGLMLSAGVYNVLDRNNRYGDGYFMAGRRFLVSAEWKY